MTAYETYDGAARKYLNEVKDWLEEDGYGNYEPLSRNVPLQYYRETATHYLQGKALIVVHLLLKWLEEGKCDYCAFWTSVEHLTIKLEDGEDIMDVKEAFMS